MFELDPTKLLFVSVAALILLGPERLPQVARRAGELWSLLRAPRDFLGHQMQDLLRTPGATVSQFLGETVGSSPTSTTAPVQFLRQTIGGLVTTSPATQLVPTLTSAEEPSSLIDASESNPSPRIARLSSDPTALPSGFVFGSPDLN
ncbi:MAG: Sec-independent protein translocase subunit TatA/TatB [Ferrimicrobium sp.]